MPWMLHKIGDEPETGTAYATRDEALSARADGYTVTRAVTDDEKAAWRQREHERFIDGTYRHVPWHSCLEDLNRYSSSRGPLAVALLDHFAHVSLDQPGMIAYTSDDAKGAEDKQTRIKPGKYLQDHAKDLFSAEEIAEFIGQVKAATAPLQIARTANEIARVYSAEDGPTSCMDGRNFSFSECPARVYAYKDLAVAYLGDISGENRSQDVIGARAVVWPDKQIYSRVYGDVDTLESALQTAGYSEGSIKGARIAAIEHGNGGYVMPYIDDVSEADLRHDENGVPYFVLGRGDYGTHQTSGYTVGGNENSCENCGEPCGDDAYCAFCEDSRFTCASCDEIYFDLDEVNSTRHGTLCSSCYSDQHHTCEACSEEFDEWDIRTFDRRRRENWDLCPSCHETCEPCADCHSYCETDDMHTCGKDHVCEECARKRGRIAPRPKGRLLRHHSASVSYVTVKLDDGIMAVPCVRSLGVWAIHRSVNRHDGVWTVTHTPTGLTAVQYAPNPETAIDLAQRLNRDGLDWNYIAESAIPSETRHTAMMLIREWRQAHCIA